MDTFVLETLCAWQLDNLIETFKDQEVDKESFLLLDSVSIAALIPKIGQRVKFQKHHKELLATNASFETSTETSPGTPQGEEECRPVEQFLSTDLVTLTPSFAIRQILQGTLAGKDIIQSLDEQRLVTISQRRALVRQLVAHLLDTNGEMPSTDTKKALAIALVHEFPCLKDDTCSGHGAWYTPGRNGKPATGFIEERLRNIRKRMRKNARRVQPQNQAVPPSAPDSDLSPEKLIEMVDWLKVNKFPQSQVEDYMKQTALHRGKWIRSNGIKSLPEILKEFPRLVDNPGMISQDFQQLHPENAGKLHEILPTLSDRILEFAQREGKLPLDFHDFTPEGALKVLPKLLHPQNYRGADGKVKRSSVDETCKAFINILPVATNMVQYLKDAEVFPHILILGDDKTMSQFFTIISGNAIEVDTLLGAVDLCFKAFFVFDLIILRCVALPGSSCSLQYIKFVEKNPRTSLF